MSKMLDLCIELQLAIVRHLEKKELKNLAQCCIKLNNLVQPLIWSSRRISYNQLIRSLNGNLFGLCKEITLYCKHWRKILLEDVDNKVIDGLSILFASANPQILRLDYHPALSHINLTIVHMNHLTELYLEDQSFRDEDINTLLSSCTANLKVLSVQDSSNTDKAYASIGKFLSLEKLTIVRAKITDAVVKEVRIHHLKELNLSECLQLTNLSMNYISMFTNLSSLNISGGFQGQRTRPYFINYLGVGYISVLPYLRELDLSYSDGVTDMSLKHVALLTELRKLNISSTAVSDLGLVYLKKLERLSDLDLSYCCSICGTSLSCLSDLPISNLSLERTDIGDEELWQLHMLPSLTYLDLSECENLSDDGMRYLENLKSLMILDVRNTAVTEMGYYNIKANLQNTIVHSEYAFGVAYALQNYHWSDIEDENESVNEAKSD